MYIDIPSDDSIFGNDVDLETEFECGLDLDEARFPVDELQVENRINN